MESNARRSWWASDLCGDLTPRDRQNVARLGWWTLVWTIAFAVATILIRNEVIPAGVVSLVAATVPAIIGFGVIRAFMRFLREVDELQRKIQLEALALGFGAGALFMMSYRLFERLGAPGLDLNDPLLVMVLAWTVGLVHGARRYR